MDQSIVDLCIDHPKAAGLLGLLVALSAGALFILFAIDYSNMPDAPEVLSLADIGTRLDGADQVWATASDAAVWDCGSLRAWGSKESPRIDAVLNSQDGTVLVVATFSESAMSCGKLKSTTPSGVFDKMDENRIAALKRNGFEFNRYPQATVLLDLCTFCGRGNSLGLLILSGTFALLGLAVYPICAYANRRRYRVEPMERGLNRTGHGPI
jgi:hypothetical protein